MDIINPQELMLGCPFADTEHTVIAKALNAIAKSIALEKKEFAFNTLLPTALDYLERHLIHEEKVLENAFLFWAEENGLGDVYEDFYKDFYNFLKGHGKDFSNYSYRDFITFFEDFKRSHPEAEELFEWLNLIEHQKKGHKNIIELLQKELEKIDPLAESKRILEQLGIAVSFVLNRVLKMDRKYVEFYKRYSIAACEEKAILPPTEVIELIEDILEKDSKQTS